MPDDGSPHQDFRGKASQKYAALPPHPSPQAEVPPKAEDHPDHGKYRSSWWQSGMGCSWQSAAIAAGILIVIYLLRNVVGPMLSPGGP